MADQTQRLEIATVRAEIGSNIVYRFTNDAANADSIPTESGNIHNLKQVVLEIQQEAAEKISISTTIYPTVTQGLAATGDQGIFLVQSSDADEIYSVWQNQGGTAINTGKTALSATAIQAALDASTEAAQAAEDAADVATSRTARYLAPSEVQPTVRDNGLPLEIGDIWFDTVNQTEYRFTAQGWKANDSLQAVADLQSRLQDEKNPNNGTSLLGWDGSPLNDHLNQSKKISSFSKLRNYTGEATRFSITDFGIAGDFYVDDEDLTSIDDNGYVIVDSRGRRIKREVLGSVRPEMFGAKSDGNINPLSDYFSTLAEARRIYPHATSLECSIDWAATQAALNYVRRLPLGGAVIFSRRPVISHELDCHPAVPVEFIWEEGCTVYTTLLGASAILFKGTNPTTPSVRGKRLVFTNPDVAFHSSVPPTAVGCVFIEHRYASNFKIQGNRGNLLHYRYNTALRVSALFNCDFGPVTIWGGGIQKPWKVQATARYSITSGSTALTSNEDVFEAADVGKVLVLQGSGINQFLTISAYVGPRAVTVSSAAQVTASGIGGNFETIRGSIASGATALVMEKACLVASDVGRVVYVLNARTGFPSPAIEPLRATIVSVESATQCTLSADASVTANNTHVVFSPGAEFFGEDDASSNDMVFDGFHTEEMRGTNLVVTRAGNLSMTNLKLHALNNFYSTSATQFRAVLASVAGHITGDFEGTCNNALGDVHISGQGGLLTFDKMTGTMSNDGCLIFAENNSAGAIINVGDWNINNPGITAKTLDNAFRIAGSGSLYQKGSIVAYAFNYTRADIRKRKTVFGKNPPAAASAGQLIVASDSAPAELDLVAAGSGNSPLLYGTGYGGTLDSPTDAIDFQTLLHAKGRANVNNTVLDTAGILFRARSPSSGEVSGDLTFYTRSSGAYSPRWSINTSGGFTPSTDNVYAIGSASLRPTQVYAVTGTINTSDEDAKQDIRPIDDKCLDAWKLVKFAQYHFKDAVELKGNGARWHFGVIAQRVESAFASVGLDARDYGLLCHDSWEEQVEVIDESGGVLQAYMPAGERYGVRYEEALVLEAALLRRTCERLESRLANIDMSEKTDRDPVG